MPTHWEKIVRKYLEGYADRLNAIHDQKERGGGKAD